MDFRETNMANGSNVSSEDYADNEPIEANILLPNGIHQIHTLGPNISLLDTVLQLCKTLHLNPSDHRLVPFNFENGREYRHKPSQKIGAFKDAEFHLVNKYDTKPKKIVQQNFEMTNRIAVDLPRNQKHAIRISPKVTIENLLRQVCTEKSLNYHHFNVCKPTDLETPLNFNSTLEELNIKHVTLVPNANYSPNDSHRIDESNRNRTNSFKKMEYMPAENTKKKKGLFSLFSRKKKDKFNTSLDCQTLPRTVDQSTKSSMPRSKSLHTNVNAAPNTTLPVKEEIRPSTSGSTKKRAPPPPPPPLSSNTSSVDDTPSRSPLNLTNQSTTRSRTSSYSSGISETPGSLTKPLRKKKKAPPPPVREPTPIIPTEEKREEEEKAEVTEITKDEEEIVAHDSISNIESIVRARSPSPTHSEEINIRSCKSDDDMPAAIQVHQTSIQKQELEDEVKIEESLEEEKQEYKISVDDKGERDEKIFNSAEMKDDSVELREKPKEVNEVEKFVEEAIVVEENETSVINEQLKEIDHALESNEIYNNETTKEEDSMGEGQYFNTISINCDDNSEQEKLVVEDNSRQALAPSPPPLKMSLEDDMKTPIEEKFIWDDSVDEKEKQSVKTEVKVEKTDKIIKDKPVEKEEMSVGSLRSVLRKPTKQRSVESDLTTSSGERLSSLWKNEDWTKEGLWGSETGLKHVENRSKIGQSKMYAAVKSRPRSFDIDVSRVNKSPTESVDEEKDEGYDSYSSRLIKTSTPIHQDSMSMSLSTSNKDSFYSNSDDRKVPPLNLDGDSNAENEAAPILRTRDVKKSEIVSNKTSHELKETKSPEVEKADESQEPINKQEDNKIHITSVFIGDDRITMTTATTEDDISSLNEENVDAFVQNLSSDSSDEELEKKPSAKIIDMRDEKGGYSHTKQTDVDQIKPVRKPSINLLTARPFVHSSHTTETKKENDRKSYRKDYDSVQKQMQQWQDRLQKNRDVLEKTKPKKEEPRPSEDPVGLFGQFTSTQLSSMRDRLKKSQTNEKNSGVALGRVLDVNPPNTSEHEIPIPPPPPPPVANVPSSPPITLPSLTTPKGMDDEMKNKPPSALKLKSGLEDKPKSRFGPVLDPHEELMLAIKSVNGRGALRKVSAKDCHWADGAKLNRS
ncbi:DgyrCDS6449 [Dimorphilus gyrociliatus]|uniref:DgyrCDS6449 n=1 Tax=Dimorphilus gyrociliatus TaxID=2664684 RepID=A0A7I8VN33_9ANNE|nr:DgyrCDS6449 [Dimorphilus gyrociliatus]